MATEDVIDVYHRPSDPECADDAGKQLVGEVRPPLSVRIGRPAKQDSEYARHGAANLFMDSSRWPVDAW